MSGHPVQVSEPIDYETANTGRPGRATGSLSSVDTHPWPEEVLFAPPSWSRSDGEPSLNSARDIAREVMHAVVGIATIGPKSGVVWRGQASVSWPLSSKLGRAPSGVRAEVDLAGWSKYEQDMILAARTTGADGAYRMTDLEILARLRHHGARTRLIDCTEDPMVGLWFACSDEIDANTDEHDGLILALDRQDFAPTTEPWVRTYDDITAPSVATGGHFVKLPPIDPRIAAQRGVFVLVAEPPSPAESPYSEVPIRWSRTWSAEWEGRLSIVCGTTPLGNRRGAPVKVFPTVIGVIVPKVVKGLVREVLKTTYGLSRTSLFPDFAGLGELHSRQ